MDDATLITKWKEGNMDAFGMLYLKHNKGLVTYIDNMDPTCPEDIAHDVWIKVNKNLHQFDGRYFKTWLMKVAHGTVIDRFRTKPKPIRWLPEYESEPDIFDNIDLDILTERQRNVVILRLQGHEFKEISRRTGIPVGTLLPAYTTAIIKIRKDLLSKGIINKVPHTDINSRYLYKSKKPIIG